MSEQPFKKEDVLWRWTPPKGTQGGWSEYVFLKDGKIFELHPDGWWHEPFTDGPYYPVMMELLRQLADAKARVEDKDAWIAAAEETFQEERTQLLHDAAAREQELKKALADANARIAGLENEKAILNDEIERLTTLTDEQAVEITSLRSHHHDAEQAFVLHSQSEIKIAELEAKLSRYREALGYAKYRIEQTQAHATGMAREDNDNSLIHINAALADKPGEGKEEGGTHG